ncbi:MAG: ABC-type transport auxiliary lipoprotein family protein [Pseudomonadota bacterium]
MRIQIAPLCLVAAGLALSACVSVLPEPSAPDALYRIDAAEPYSGLQSHVTVREPEAPRLIAGPGLVSEARDGALRLIPGVEWSGSATRQMQLAMIDSFEVGTGGHALLPELGVIAPVELASQFKVFNLRGETAVCEMTISLVTSGQRDLLARTEIKARATAASRSGRDRAQAMRLAGSDCAAQAAGFVIETLAARD